MRASSAGILSAAAMVAACLSITPAASAQGVPSPASSGDFVPDLLYTPSPSVIGTMTVEQARAILKEYYVSEGWRDVTFTRRDITVLPKKSKDPSWSKALALMEPQVIRDGRGIGTTYALVSQPKADVWVCKCLLAMAAREKHVATYRRLADAYLVLKLKSSVALDPEFQQQFDDAARTYRTMAVKPAPPEPVRRALVQGAALIKENDFSAAAEVYEDALRAVPWWPDGHYNLAYVLSSLEQYGQAIVEMKRFILLTPESSEARVAQDMIYQWELKIRQGNR